MMMMMRRRRRRMDAWPLMALGLAMALFHLLNCPNVAAIEPLQELDWQVEYMTVYTLGVEQRVIAINGQFPGPQLQTTTNTLNLRNGLDEPFLLTWKGIQQRRNAWQDGVLGTNCPILPGQSWTYKFSAKDQIGSFSYFPSTNLHRTAGGFGSIRVDPRIKIVSPFSSLADDFPVLIGGWYKSDHKELKTMLDDGSTLPAPDNVLINGHAPLGAIFTVEKGKTYRFRVSNIGSSQALNFRIEGHRLLLAETEGSYVELAYHDTLDVHLGQSYSVLVTMDQSDRDYYLVASTRFASPVLNGIGAGVVPASGGGGGPATEAQGACAPLECAAVRPRQGPPRERPARRPVAVASCVTGVATRRDPLPRSRRLEVPAMVG